MGIGDNNVETGKGRSVVEKTKVTGTSERERRDKGGLRYITGWDRQKVYGGTRRNREMSKSL